MTISGGVASCDTDGSSMHDLLASADQALYLAKEQGRNRVLAFKGRYLSGETEDQESLGFSSSTTPSARGNGSIFINSSASPTR